MEFLTLRFQTASLSSYYKPSRLSVKILYVEFQIYTIFLFTCVYLSIEEKLVQIIQ